MFKKRVLYAVVGVVLLSLVGRVQADTITVGPEADTYVLDATPHGDATYLYLHDTLNGFGYLRFNLSSYNITGVQIATLRLRTSGNAPRNDNVVAGRFVLNGLNSIAGNTPQNWDEATLTSATVGAEWTTNAGASLVNVTVMDDTTAGITETITLVGANYSAAGGMTIVVTGDPLAQFIQSRAQDGGLVTFVLEMPGTTGRGYGICSSEYTTAEWQPVLELTATVGPKTAAFSPSPADKATEVLRDSVLRWTSGASAVAHDLYFGTSLDAVNAATRTDPKGVLISQGQDANTYDPAALIRYGQTYYWRIDEVLAPPDSTVTKGSVWTFAVEPYSYPITTPIQATASSISNTLTGPEKTIDGSGLNASNQHSTNASDMWLSKSKQTPVWIQYEFDRVYKLHQMWVWNSNQLLEPDSGYGAKDVTIETSTDGTTWTALPGVQEFAQATAAPDYVYNTTVDFGGVLARYVRLNITSNWGDARSSGLSEVRFFYAPVKAFGPTPTTGSTAVAVDGVLNWRPGRTAAGHEVYLGTDSNALSKVGTVTDHLYGLTSAGAEYDRTYYWKVNEVNAAETWEGDVWSFSTPGYVVVDNFEPYNDTCNRIFYTWADGYGVATPECGGSPVAGNGSGSTVGNASAPYAERTIVHGGSQSMPMAFDNPGATSYSEATRTFDVPQDWTKGGIKTLVLYFHGALDNAAGQMYVKINNNKVVYNGKADVLAMPLWTQWNIDLASVGGALRSVTSLTIGVSGSGKGVVYVDDLRLYRSAPAVVQSVDPGTAGLSAYYAMDGDVKDSSGKGYHGTLNNDPVFVDAPTGFGKALQFDGVNDYVDLPIGQLIGTLGSVTIATRVSFDTASTGSYQRIFDFGTGTTAYLFLTPRVATNGVIRAAIRNTTSTAESLVNSPAAMPRGWHHVAVAIDGASRTLQLYFDGERVASGPTTVLLSDLGPTTQNWLGRSQWTADGYLAGALDEFRIYSRALSAGEVRYLAGDR